MRSWNTISCAVVALAACSSSEPSNEGGPSIPLGLVMTPRDGRTAVGAATPALSVSGLFARTDPLSDPLVPQLAGDLSLATYPEGARVEGSVVAVLASGTDFPGAQVRLEFHASTPLPDRWYALRLRTVPARTHLDSAGLPFRSLADGAIEARFRIGSEPSPLAIDFCRKGGTETFIAFSEPVHASLPAPPFSVTYADGSAPPHCDFSFAALPPGATPIDRPLAPVDSFQGRCTDLDPTKAARFIVGEGMTTIEGVAVPATSVTINLPSLPASETPCKRWFRSF
jgi:hypothetical protein